MRYIATRLHGDGTETIVADELPISGGRVQRSLSGPGGLTGAISPEVSRLRSSDGLLLAPGRTAIYALSDHGTVLGGGILTPKTSRTGHQMRVDCAGHSGYLYGQPYLGDEKWIEVDPADLFRHAWEHVQARPYHNLGMVIDTTTTPERVGTEEREVTFTTRDGEDVSFLAGPVKWNFWTTHDLGRVTEQLATDTPFDYVTEHTWNGTDTVTHFVRMAYPRIGRRRHDLSFVVGVNILVEPAVSGADDASDVIVLGSGEGSSARRGEAHRDTGGLGRTITVVDKTLTTNVACSIRARQYMSWVSGGDEVSTVTVHDHPNAPIGSWAVGDDIRLMGNGAGWAGDLDVWVRVLSEMVDVEAGTVSLTVTRAERT